MSGPNGLETEPTPRQVLYALVGAGFVIVVAILVIGAAIAGLAPVWWTVISGLVTVGWTVWAGRHWRRTAVLLLGSIGLFAVWAIVTLLIA